MNWVRVKLVCLYVVLKNIRDIKIGDTIICANQKETPALEGYEEVQPMVFCGIFPVESHDYEMFKESLEKLTLNDASFTYEPETSKALGFGFRCGFLGLLHMNIVQERLEREFELNLISTAPSVNYRVIMMDGTSIEVSNPSEIPDAKEHETIEEPLVGISIHVPKDYIGNIIKLCEERRGRQVDMKYLTEDRIQLFL